MPRKLPLHVVRERTRHGRVVFYFRMDKGARTRLPDDLDSRAFREAYNALLKGEPVPNRKAPHRAQGSLAWLIDRHYESAVWNKHSDATKKQRRLIYAEAVKRSKNIGYMQITTKLLQASVESRAATPAQANNFLKAMRALFKWAKRAGYVEDNPAKDVERVQYKARGFTAWTVDDAQRFCDYWAIGTMPRLAFELFACSGVRRGDMHVMGMQHVKGRTLYMRTAKSGVPITVDLTDRALEAIEATGKPDMAFMRKPDGQPFKSKESFGNWFSARCREADLETGKSAHGIRKLAATLAADGGASTHALMAHFGWQTVQQAETYTRGSDRTRLGKASSALLAGEIENKLPRTSETGAGNRRKSTKKTMG